MNQNNNNYPAQKNKDARIYPNFTLSSFSSMTGGDVYLAIEIWANRATLTFVDQSDRDNIRTLRLFISIDKVYILHEYLREINSVRILSYREGKPYPKIPTPIKITLSRPGSKPEEGREPFLAIYTKEKDGIERVCLCGVEGDHKIEVMMGTTFLDMQVSDPDRLVNIDLQDIVLSKLTQTISSLPFFIPAYKLALTFFESFIGIVRKDKVSGSYYNSGEKFSKNYGSNQNYMGDYKKSQVIEINPEQNINSNDDVPF